MIKKEFIVNNIRKIKIKLYSFLDKEKLLNDKERFKEEVKKEIKELNLKDNFAGFLDEKGFEEYLDFNIFDNEIAMRSSEKINVEEYFKSVKKALNKIIQFLPESLEIYLFPTNSKYVLEKMGCCSGKLIWKNIIYLEIFPEKNIDESIQSSLVHEIAHNNQKGYSFDMDIGEAIVYEGIAENFQQNKIHIKTPWAHALSEKDANKIAQEVKNRLKEKYIASYREIFYGVGNLPLWAGYSIGYYLVKEYIQNNKVSWEELFSINPSLILKNLIADRS